MLSLFSQLSRVLGMALKAFMHTCMTRSCKLLPRYKCMKPFQGQLAGSCTAKVFLLQHHRNIARVDHSYAGGITSLLRWLKGSRSCCCCHCHSQNAVRLRYSPQLMLLIWSACMVMICQHQLSWTQSFTAGVRNGRGGFVMLQVKRHLPKFLATIDGNVFPNIEHLFACTLLAILSSLPCILKLERTLSET